MVVRCLEIRGDVPGHTRYVSRISNELGFNAIRSGRFRAAATNAIEGPTGHPVYTAAVILRRAMIVCFLEYIHGA